MFPCNSDLSYGGGGESDEMATGPQATGLACLFVHARVRGA